MSDSSYGDWDATARELLDLDPETFCERWESIVDPAESLEALRLRFRYDIEGFCRFCWPDRFDLPFNALHRSLFSQALQIERWQDRTVTIRDAVAAPRGYAKSTISSFAMVVHAMVYDLEAYIVLLSAGQRLAKSLSTDIMNAFSEPESPLAKLYGPFKVSGGVEEFEVSVRGRPTIGVLERSFGTEVRGAKHPKRGIRPTLVVLDDAEKKDRVRSADQRRIWWETLTKDVLKLGRRSGGTVFWLRGTVLHTDSLLANVLKHPGWRGAKWQAIKSWPIHPELWEECRQIWADLTHLDRVDRARAFYEAHKIDMDWGAEVLDPDAEDLFDLYEQIWGEGLASFLQEKQNDPVDPSTRLFDLSRIMRCRVVGDVVHALDRDGKVVRKIPFSELRFYAHLDPALGKDAGLPGDTGSGAGDYASIAVIGRDRHGYGYLVKLWMRRATPNQQLMALWEMHELYGFHRVGIESNGFQALMGRDFETIRAERRAAGKSYQLAVDCDPSTDEKTTRIATLEVPLSNGWLYVGDIDQEGLNQVLEFPTASHDDAPDSIEACWRLSRAPVSGGVPFQPGGPPASSRPGARR